MGSYCVGEKQKELIHWQKAHPFLVDRPGEQRGACFWGRHLVYTKFPVFSCRAFFPFLFAKDYIAAREETCVFSSLNTIHSYLCQVYTSSGLYYLEVK